MHFLRSYKTRCSLASCPNAKKRQGVWYLGKDSPEEVATAWRDFCNNQTLWPFLCAAHFREEDFERSAVYMAHYPNAKQRLKKTAIPSIIFMEQSNENLNETNEVNEASNSSSNTEDVPQILPPSDPIDIIMIDNEALHEMEKVAMRSKFTESCSNDIKPSFTEDVLPKADDVTKLQEEIELLKNQAYRLLQEKQRLQEKVSSLKAQNQILTKIKQEKDNMEEALLETFSQNELDLLLKRKSHVVWRRKEIQEAFLIRYLSKTCYKYLRNKKHYPLPSAAAIDKWTNKYGVNLSIMDELEMDSE